MSVQSTTGAAVPVAALTVAAVVAVVVLLVPLLAWAAHCTLFGV